MEVSPQVAKFDEVGEGAAEGEFDLAPVLAQLRRDGFHAEEPEDLLFAPECLQAAARRVDEAAWLQPVPLFERHSGEPG